MEFFKIIPVKTNEKSIQNVVTLDRLEEFSNLVFNLDTPKESESEIGGLWGEFTLQRSLIKGGVRFALLDCPNALCWTITAGYLPREDALVVHLTINRTQKEKEFLEEIEDFLDDHIAKLNTLFTNY